MTPKSLLDPGKPDGIPARTLTRWDTFIGDIASGMAFGDAQKKCYVTRADIETMTRLDDGGLQRQRYKDAITAGRKRAWSIFEFQDIWDRIASGMTNEAAVKAVKGTDIANTDFYAIVNADPDLWADFRKAQEARSLFLGESVLVEAANREGDVLEGPKGPMPNMANVTRSKLVVDTTFRYIGAYNSKLFGEKKDNVQVNVQINHAERLEEARARATQRERRVTPKQMAAAIDATFSEKTAEPAVDDTNWMDDKPVETVWREET